MTDPTIPPLLTYLGLLGFGGAISITLAVWLRERADRKDER